MLDIGPKFRICSLEFDDMGIGGSPCSSSGGSPSSGIVGVAAIAVDSALF